jgi:PTS system N-acetylglucosamine-specific IIC component
MNPSRFAGVQQLGRALMLPIAVLPVAGLLLRLGQPDLLGITVMAQAGDAIFANLALIFAIGVAVGFARENNGTAGLAGAIGYLVLSAVLKASDASINMGVLAGITAGLSAGLLYNRFKDITLPSYLAFFGGKRFVPISTGFAMLLAGVLLSLIWPPVQRGIDVLGHWLIGAGGLGLFIYGVLNRLLIVTGLHHILNSLTWFVFGSFADPLVAGKIATGDLNRFFAGDPTAGSFMTGFFPVMMFGLPAACLAIYRAARPENRAAVGGLLLSMGLTAMLTGVTEPVEFSFMFLAPLLYALHALLTGLSMALMHALDVRLGFTFSAGLFDYLLSFGKGHNGLLLLPVGLAYGLVYYLLFSFFIRRFQLPTMGREEEGAAPAPAPAASGSTRAQGLLVALGGAANLRSVDACTTRLRLQVVDNAAIDAAALRALGARGVIMPAPGSVQVVLGPEADQVADELRALQGQAAAVAPAVPPATPTPAAQPQSTALRLDRSAWLLALGGESNVQRIEAVAGTRLRVVLGDAARVDETALLGLGALGLQSFSPALVHVLLADAAAAHAALLAERSAP